MRGTSRLIHTDREMDARNDNTPPRPPPPLHHHYTHTHTHHHHHHPRSSSSRGQNFSHKFCWAKQFFFILSGCAKNKLYVHKHRIIISFPRRSLKFLVLLNVLANLKNEIAFTCPWRLSISLLDSVISPQTQTADSITVTSLWAYWRLKSPASRLFT